MWQDPARDTPSHLRLSPVIATKTATRDNHGHDFISICTDHKVPGGRRRILQPPSMQSVKSNPLSPGPTGLHDKMKPVTKSQIKRGKIHGCPILGCPKRYSRPCDVRTHLNTHTGEQPFQCAMPSCQSKFGVRSNMLRHNISHGLPRTGKVHPPPPYIVEFQPVMEGPPVPSDATSMRQVVWNDSDGPFVRRHAHSTGSRTPEVAWHN
ncbi:hypothetical protein DFH09DRAFT_1135028 [Mycena vulgaris]|nr:hypothetical protein DFH09DRAFT_1135028 [Mycena vulgaris]